MQQSAIEYPRRPRVLVVDDEEPNLATFRRVFRKDLEVHAAQSADEALRLCRSTIFDVCFTDYLMPSRTGVEFLRELRDVSPGTGRVILTAFGDMPDVRNALESGLSFSLILKPWSKERILATVDRFRTLADLGEVIQTLRTQGAA